MWTTTTKANQVEAAVQEISRRPPTDNTDRHGRGRDRDRDRDRRSYPTDAGTIALAHPDGLQDADEFSAVFCVSDASIIDRDGDRVNPQGIRTSNWERAGSPVYFGHQSHPYPIGTCINPDTGKLDFWIDGDRVFAKIHFDMEDPTAAFIAGKVKRGLLRSTSIAFVPIQAYRREAGAVGGGFGEPNRPHGWDYEEVDMSELSVVGVGSNPNAVLQGASKSIMKCLGCRSSWTPEDEVEREIDKCYRWLARMSSPGREQVLSSLRRDAAQLKSLTKQLEQERRRG